MTTDEVIQYYQGLLILQYRALPKAVAHVGLWAAEFIQNQIASQVRDAFDLDTAVGAQLDILGAYRGVSRTIFGVVPASDWSLIPYLDPLPDSYLGWNDYSTDPIPATRWLQYNDLNGAAYKLSDVQIRTLIKLKAQFDAWDGTLGNLDNILYAFFGSNVSVVDNENMSIAYNHLASDPDPNTIWGVAVLSQLVPHPAGVSVTFNEV